VIAFIAMHSGTCLFDVLGADYTKEVVRCYLSTYCVQGFVALCHIKLEENKRHSCVGKCQEPCGWNVQAATTLCYQL
jgi:hypothetical protein